MSLSEFEIARYKEMKANFKPLVVVTKKSPEDVMLISEILQFYAIRSSGVWYTEEGDPLLTVVYISPGSQELSGVHVHRESHMKIPTVYEAESIIIKKQTEVEKMNDLWVEVLPEQERLAREFLVFQQEKTRIRGVRMSAQWSLHEG